MNTMTKPEARKKLFNFAHSLHDRGFSAEEYMELFTETESDVPMPKDLKDAYALVPEAIPHIVAWIWNSFKYYGDK